MRDDRSTEASAKSDSTIGLEESGMTSNGMMGLAGVAKRSEELASQRGGFGLRKFTSEFRWDGNKPKSENAISLRVLGDDIIVPTMQHRGVPLPENKFFFGICRHAFPINADFCYVCDVIAKEFDGDDKAKKRAGLKPTDVAVALAVEMEAITEGRRFVGYRPKMVEFEIPQTTDDEKSGKVPEEAKEYRKLLDMLGQPGTKVQVPHIGLIVGTIAGQQAIFDWPSRRKSISDRVFEVSRTGKGLDTKWDWDHEGPDQEQPDPAPLLAEYSAKYPFEMPMEWVMRNGSEERYNHFFKLTSDDSSSEYAGESADDGKDEEDPVSDTRAALMRRLQGKGSGS